jgi:EmrB/QacA subfamily drug resistance transporter
MPAPAALPATTERTTPILAVLLLAGLSYALSQTMVFPALPSIAEHFHAGPSASSWVLTSFFLSASVATPLAGKLGDLYGKDRVLPLVLLLLAAGSVMCALASSIDLVIAGRAVQGVAGGIFPLSFGIIRDTFPRDRIAAGIGLLSAVFGIGGGIGLPLSGIVVENFDISWLFWISLIAVPALIGVRATVPPSPRVQHARVDWLGAALLSLGLVALLLGVTEGNDWGWGAPRTIGLLAVGLAVISVWLAVERVVADPLVDLRILRRRAVLTTNVTTLLVGFGMFAAFALIPRFAQAPESTGYGFALSVTESGLILLPSALVQLAVGPLAGRLGIRFGFRVTLVTGAALSVVSFLLLATLHDTPLELLVAAIFLGMGVAFAFASMANLIVAAVPQSDVGIATGINTIMRTVGGAFGSAAVTAILAGQVAASGLPRERGYTIAFIASSVAGVLAIVAAWLVPGVSRPAPPAPEPAGEREPAGVGR